MRFWHSLEQDNLYSDLLDSETEDMDLVVELECYRSLTVIRSTFLAKVRHSGCSKKSTYGRCEYWTTKW